MYSTTIQRMVLLKLILEHTTAVFLGEICLLPCDFVGQLILLWGLSVLIAQVQENNYFWPRASKSKPVFSQKKYSIYEDLKIVEMSFCFVADIQELRMVKNGLNDLGSSIKVFSEFEVYLEINLALQCCEIVWILLLSCAYFCLERYCFPSVIAELLAAVFR